MWEAVQQVWQNPYVRVVVGLGVLVGLYFLLQMTQAVWGSVLTAYLIAFLLNPLVSWFERRKFYRGVGVMVVVLLFMFALLGLWLLGIQIAAQLAVFLEALPTFAALIEELPFLISRQIDPSFGTTFQQVFVSLQSSADRISNVALPSLQAFVSGGGITRQLGQLSGGGFTLVITLILTLYLLFNFADYSRSFLRTFPHRYRPTVAELLEQAGFAIGGYIRGQVLIAALVGVLTGLGLFLLGIPLAFGLGVIAGVANLIPFFGPLIATVPTVLFSLTEGWGSVLGAVGVLLVVQQIDAHLLTPLVFSQVIDIDPVTIIVVVLLGSALFGVLGAILAVPVTVFLTLLYRDYYLDSRWYKAPRQKAE